jgi:hypothetical protein
MKFPKSQVSKMSEKDFEKYEEVIGAAMQSENFN